MEEPGHPFQTLLPLTLVSSHLSSSQSCPPQTLTPAFPLPVLTSPLFASSLCMSFASHCHLMAVSAPLQQVGQQREEGGKPLCVFSFPTSRPPRPQRTQPSDQCLTLLHRTKNQSRKGLLLGLPWKKEVQGLQEAVVHPSCLRQE